MASSGFITGGSSGAPNIATDISGILSVTNSKQLAGYSFTNIEHDLRFNKKITGAATIALNTALASQVLTTPVTSGARAEFQTKKLMRYHVGRAIRSTYSITVGTGKTNLVKRFGVYSTDNGFFFEQDGVDLFVVMRSNITGSLVNTRIARSSWNGDRADGSGASGFTLDITKSAVFVIENSWDGSGICRFSIQYNKSIVVLHEMLLDNVNTYASTRTPFQPLRVEIENTGTVVSQSSLYLHAISAYVNYSENLKPMYIFSASNDVTAKAVTIASDAPIMSLRQKLTSSGFENRVIAELMGFTFYNKNAPMIVKIILNGTLTAPTWVTAATSSVCDRDTFATAINGGVTVFQTYVASGTAAHFGLASGNIASTDWDNFVLGANIDYSIADTLTITARSLTVISTGYCSVFWGETL